MDNDFGLDLSSILSDEELVNLKQPDNGVQEETEETKETQIENEIDTEGLKADDFFENPESVGGDKDSIQDEGNPDEEKSEVTSPNNTYSSIASAFKTDGVPLFTDADNDRLGNIQSSDDFEQFITERINTKIEEGLNEAQKRVLDALEYGVHPSDIQVFENSIKNLNSVKEEDIKAESDEGESLRRQLILTDLTSKGISEPRALKMVQQSFDAGRDVDDATDALESLKDYYQKEYDRVLSEQKAEYEKRSKAAKAESDKLRKDILESEKPFGDVVVDKAVRQKIYDNLMRPTMVREDGSKVTAIQKYADEHPADFRKYLGYFFTVTDGFKSLDKFKDSVRKEVRKKEISALDSVINSTSRNSDGTLKLMGGNYSSGLDTKGWQIDI